jgi:hypothetical protein
MAARSKAQPSIEQEMTLDTPTKNTVKYISGRAVFYVPKDWPGMDDPAEKITITITPKDKDGD